MTHHAFHAIKDVAATLVARESTNADIVNLFSPLARNVTVPSLLASSGVIHAPTIPMTSDHKNV